MDVLEVVEKLIGSIDPVGSSNVDNIRKDNLRIYIKVAGAMLIKIDNLRTENSRFQEASIKEMVEMCNDFFESLN